ncbi:uncharacterized protein LOC100377645 [Saccoglossus kowalevskii]
MATSRLNNDEYKNWLRVGRSLLEMCKGLDKFITAENNNFHSQLKTKLPACTSKNCKGNENKPPSKRKHVCPVCAKWEVEILTHHSNKGSVYWQNADNTKWFTVAWEVAKVFMPRGQKKTVTTASETDSSALLNLMSNCKKFHAYIKDTQKVLKVRNDVMHSVQMKFTTQEMQDNINKILHLLQASNIPSQYTDVQDAIQNIKEILRVNFVITEEMELSVLRDKFKEFENKLEELDNRITPELQKAVESFQDFINGNSDLQGQFQNELSSLEQRINSLEGRVDDVAKEVEVIGEELKKMKGDNTPKLQAKYKIDLQTNAQRNKFESKYTYILLSCIVCCFAYQIYILGILGRSLVSCEVTVGEQTYRSTIVTSKPKDAEQDAARVALVELGQSGDEEPVSLSVEEYFVNYKNVLQEHCQKTGLHSPDYETTKIKEDPPQFIAWLTYKAIGKSKKYLSESLIHTSAKKAEQSAAKVACLDLKLALPEPIRILPKPMKSTQPTPPKEKELMQPPDNSDEKSQTHSPPAGNQQHDDFINYKNILQEHCQKNRFDTPKYESTKIQDNPAQFTTVLTYKTLGNTVKYSSEGLTHSNKKESEQSAAKVACLGLDLVSSDTTKSPTKPVSTQPTNKCDVKSQISASPVENKQQKKLTLVSSPPKKAAEDAPECHQPAPTSSPDGSAVVQDNYKGKLQEFLTKAGVTNRPVYETTQVDMKFISTFKLDTKYAIQTTTPFESKRKAEEHLAKQILQSLKIETQNVTSFKSRLNEIDPKTPAKYITEVVDPNALSKTFKSLVISKTIVDDHQIELKGDMCNSKKRAEQNVAASALAFIEKYLSEFLLEK